MKKALILLTILSTTVAISQMVKAPKEEKKYTVSLTLKDWDMFVQQLETIKAKVKGSNLPANEVYYMVDSIITPFQQISVGQLRQQLAADTLKKK